MLVDSILLPTPIPNWPFDQVVSAIWPHLASELIAHYKIPVLLIITLFIVIYLVPKQNKVLIYKFLMK